MIKAATRECGWRAPVWVLTTLLLSSSLPALAQQAPPLKPETALPMPKPIQLAELQLRSHTGAFLNSHGNNILRIVFSDGRLEIASEGDEPPRIFTAIGQTGCLRG